MPSQPVAGRRTQSSRVHLAVGLLCVALCTAIGQVTAAAPAAAGSPADSAVSSLAVSPEVEAMIDWMHQHGGKVNVIVRTLPNLGRKVYAPRDFTKGDILCEIPLSCAFTMYADEGMEMWSYGGAKMYEEMGNPDSPYQPYFKVLPPRERVWSFYDIPASYMPLIQNEALEENIASLQGEKLSGVNSSSEESEGLRYTLSVLETRAFGAHGGEGLQMLPVLDMADHTNECTNYYNIGTCGDSGSSSSSSDEDADRDYDCIIWYAGEDIRQGQEVCNNYRYLAQDTSLLQYGFLQEGPVVQLLSRIDRHDFNPQDPWVEPAYGDHGVERFEPVSPEQTKAEISRLQQLLKELKAKDAELKDTVEPHPRDNGGWYLKQLWIWREQRQAAIELEIARLSKVLKRLEAAFEVYDKPKPQAVYDNLLVWLKGHGAQVNVEVKPQPASDLSAASGSLQGVFASKALEAGDSLAAIPLELTFSIKGGGSGHIMDAALSIMQDMYLLESQSDGSGPAQDARDTSQAKFWAPYYATLPTLGSLKTVSNIPVEYAALLQQHDMEAMVTDVNTDINTAWSAARAGVDAVTNQSLTRADLRHMAAVVSSRTVSAGSGGLRLIPLIDLAQYNNSCPHTVHFSTCPSAVGSSSRTGVCMIWTAGKKLAAGDEVCTAHHGHLLPDVALLQYGIVMPEDVTQDNDAALFGLDDNQYDIHELFGGPGVVHAKATPFTGTKDEALAEAASLTIFLQQITSEESEADMAAVTAVAEDWGGRLLQQLKRWRQQRITAIRHEIERLVKQHGLVEDEIAAEVDRQMADAAQSESDEQMDTDTQEEHQSDHSEL